MEKPNEIINGFMDLLDDRRISIHEYLNINTAHRIFQSILPGNADITKEVLKELLDSYDVEGIRIDGDNIDAI